MPDNAGKAELEAELRQVVAQAEPLPAGLIEAAVGAFTWRTIGAELAELVFDSLADHDEAALVRGAGRILSFSTSALTIDVEVTGTGDSRTLVGQLQPPQRASLDIRRAGNVDTVETDEMGRFSAGPLHPGPVSLRCRYGGQTAQPPVVTDWVAI